MVKKMRAYDMDFTIVRSDAKTIVTHSDGSVTELDPIRYVYYQPQIGDRFDYSQFDADFINPKQIRQVVDAFKKDLMISNQNKIVCIVTARGNPKPIKNYLYKMNIPSEFVEKIRIYCLGTGKPQTKADLIEGIMTKEQITDCEFFDDAQPNREAVATLQDKHPEWRVEVKPFTWGDSPLDESFKRLKSSLNKFKPLE